MGMQWQGHAWAIIFSMSGKNIAIAIVAALLGVAVGIGVSQCSSLWSTGDRQETQQASVAQEQVQQAPSAQQQEAQQANQSSVPSTGGTSTVPTVRESGTYTSKDEVAAYIHEFGHLPSNYISKTKARNAGWVAKEGNLDEVLPGMSIGGSEFYNDEGQLPAAPGRTWTECDINYEGGYRGAERIVFSNDGLIFYTADHYETFEQLY